MSEMAQKEIRLFELMKNNPSLPQPQFPKYEYEAAKKAAHLSNLEQKKMMDTPTESKRGEWVEEIVGSRFLVFKNHQELIKTLNSLSEGQVALIGYIDEKEDIQRLDLNRIRSEAQAEILEKIIKDVKAFNPGNLSGFGSASAFVLHGNILDYLATLTPTKGKEKK